MAGVQVLLGRYARAEEVVLGTPLANRSRPELEGIIGYFVNTVALRTDLSGLLNLDPVDLLLLFLHSPVFGTLLAMEKSAYARMEPVVAAAPHISSDIFLWRCRTAPLL